MLNKMIFIVIIHCHIFGRLKVIAFCVKKLPNLKIQFDIMRRDEMGVDEVYSKLYNNKK